MSKMIKYAVKCNSLYKLIAVISVCALLGTSLCFVCDTIQHITDKICEYKDWELYGVFSVIQDTFGRF